MPYVGENHSKSKSNVAFYQFLNWNIFNFSLEESISSQLCGHLKRKSLKQGQFQPLLFFHSFSKIFSLLSFTRKKQSLPGKRRQFLYKRNNSLNQWPHLFSHIDTPALTSPVDKVVELLFFEASRIT